MLKLQDFSDVMQMVIASGATFMISKSGIPGHYSVNAAYHNKCNKSVHLTFNEKEGVAVQAADGEHPVIEFGDVSSVVDYMLKEVGSMS